MANFDTTGTTLQFQVVLLDDRTLPSNLFLRGHGDTINLTVGSVSEEGIESSWTDVLGQDFAQTFPLTDGLRRRSFCKGQGQLSGPSGLMIGDVIVSPLMPVGTLIFIIYKLKGL